MLPKLPILLGLLILPFITPFLTNVDYGVYGIILSLVTGINVIKTLGLEVVLMNVFIHHSHSRSYRVAWNQIQGFIFLFSLILGLFTAFFLNYILPEEVYDKRFIAIFLTVIPILFYSSLQIISLKYYQLSEKPLQLGFRSLIFGLLNVCLTYYFIAIEKMGFMGWVWSIFISETLTFFSYIYPIWIKNKLYPNLFFRWSSMKEYLRISLPILPHTSAFFLLDFSDRLIMLKLGVNTANIGLYDFAYKFAGYTRVFSESIHQASTPLLLKEYKKKSDGNFLRDIIFVENYLVSFVAFSVAIWLKEIFSLLVNNKELNSTYDLGIILTMAYAYKPMYTAMATVFYYHGKTKEFWKISLVAGILNIVLNLIFIPIFGYEVAVITTFISFLYIGYSGFITTSFRKLYRAKFYPIHWFFYTVVLLFIAYAFKNSDIKIKLSINFILILFTFFKLIKLFKKLNEKDFV